MRKSRFIEEQIAGMLKESEAELGTDELCLRNGISSQMFCRWKAKYGEMSVSEAQRLKQLEDDDPPHAVTPKIAVFLLPL